MPSKEYEEVVGYDLAQRAKVCRHYDALDRGRHNEKTGCARGVPIEAKLIEANNGSRFGIALRMPCMAAKDPLFVCPWFEARGVEAARDQMISLRAAGARTLAKLAKQLQEKEQKTPTPHADI